ncbi:hypothetical protein ACOMHN_012749 [Nucella lapillus]
MGQFTIFQDHRSPLHVQCGRVLLVALIPGVIAVVSEHWLAAPSTPTPAPTLTSTPGAPTPTSSPEESMWRYVRYMGLWAACNSHYRCASLPSDHFPDAYGPVRSMLVTALCLHALCIGVGALCSCEDPDNLLGASRHMPRMEETLALLAGILIAGSLGLFAQISQQHPVYRTFHFDWSFWLMLAYLFLLLLAGGVILLLRNKCACRKRCTCHSQADGWADEFWLVSKNTEPVILAGSRKGVVEAPAVMTDERLIRFWPA